MITKTEKFILKYLKNKEWTSPTEIGKVYGKYINTKSTNYHSAWASPRCKKLIEKGVIKRNEKGHYKLKD